MYELPSMVTSPCMCPGPPPSNGKLGTLLRDEFLTPLRYYKCGIVTP